MVSLWPWKGEDNSPASFEKALAALAAKISQSQAHLDSLRSNNRRYRALFTLYSSFAYLLCAVVLFLVVGWRNWTPIEYTAIAGSPVVIYLIRTAITAYYNFRIDSATNRLKEQQATRARTIAKLKAATKYDSTQELLEKYGGAPPKLKKEKEPKTPAKPVENKRGVGRVGTGPPPPTANIGRPEQIPSHPSTPQAQIQQPQFPKVQFHNPNQSPIQTPSPIIPQIQPQRPTAEFAPNAFSAPPTYAQPSEVGSGGNWYDRVLDLLMGEDETSPKNRVALICQNCRLVNGQAPPGTKRFADLGKWRCFGCGGWNGEEDEGAKAVKEMKERIGTDPVVEKEPEEQNILSVEDENSALLDEGDVENADDEEADDDDSEEVVEAPKPAKRGRPRGSKKKT